MPSNSAAERVHASVLPADAVGTLAALPTPELRAGEWTRHGERSLLGDPVAESMLGEVAESVRAAARAQGYAVGWASGRRDAAAAAQLEAAEAARQREAEDERREAEHRAAVEALSAAAAQVRALLEELTQAVEKQGSELAWALTEQLVEHEMSATTGPDVVRRVLRVLPASGLASVHLHPAVAADPAVRALVDQGLTIVPDPGLGRADARVEANGTVVDLRISEAMERVREVLGAPAPTNDAGSRA